MLMDSNEPQQSAVGEPAGQQLKRARESHGLSLKDIADAQHLRVSVIQAIEDGNYHEIDSELFLKGYARAYAKHVGADADALIQLLDRELEPTRRERDLQEQENPLIDIERRRRKKRQLAKAFGVIIVLGAIALAGWKLVLEPRMEGDVAAVQGETASDDMAIGSAEAENAGAAASSAAGSVEGSAEGSGMESVPEASLEDVDASPAPDTEQGSAVVVGDTESSPDVQPGDMAEPLESAEATESLAMAYLSGGQGADPGMDDARNENSEANAGSDIPTGAVAVVEPVVEPDPVFEESAQPQSVAASTQLEMSFVSDCWVQVTDSSGARLVASLQRDGDRISVSGRAPLTVVIGAVDAVETVRFGGDPVNLSSFRVVNNRTEFSLTL